MSTQIETTAAARILGISSEMVRTLANQGLLPSTRTESGRRLFLRDDVERLAAERARNPPQRGGNRHPRGKDEVL